MKLNNCTPYVIKHKSSKMVLSSFSSATCISSCITTSICWLQFRLPHEKLESFVPIAVWSASPLQSHLNLPETKGSINEDFQSSSRSSTLYDIDVSNISITGRPNFRAYLFPGTKQKERKARSPYQSFRLCRWPCPSMVLVVTGSDIRRTLSGNISQCQDFGMTNERPNISPTRGCIMPPLCTTYRILYFLRRSKIATSRCFKSQICIVSN